MSEIFPLERAAGAYERMMSGKTRYRAILTTKRQLKHLIRVFGVLNAMDLFNGISRSTFE